MLFDRLILKVIGIPSANPDKVELADDFIYRQSHQTIKYSILTTLTTQN